MTEISTAPRGFEGRFVFPADTEYEEDHKISVSQYDRRPAAIAHCASTADIRRALLHGREHGAEIAVRSGRHSVPGYSTTEGGLVIDVGGLKGMELDRDACRGRIQAGVISEELLPAAAREGLVAVGGSEPQPSFVGLAIHGGRGLLSRRHGWASDQIRAGKLITAAGEEIAVSAEQNPELLFGLRGAGSNFGIVTELETDLPPIPSRVLAGKLLYDRAGMSSVLPFLLDGLEGLFSDGMGVLLTFFAVAEGAPMLELKVVHLDQPEQARADIDRLASVAEPVEGEVSPVSYAEMIVASEIPPFDSFEWAEQGTELAPAALAAALIEEAAKLPVGEDPELPHHYLTIEPFGPGFLREPDLPTAVPRRCGSSIAFFTGWNGRDRDEEMIGWTRGNAARLRAEGVGNDVPILNYNSVTGPDAVRRAYGEESYRELQRLKRIYDPENVFHRNHNVEPAA